MPATATPRPSAPGTHPLLALAGWLLLTFAAGAVGGIASRDASGFYAQLDRPAWAPPASVFGPVWSTLYLLIGIAAWLVWRARDVDDGARRRALALFVGQLVLNALWTWLFFGWRMGGAAVAEIALLWLAIAATLAAFWRVRRVAGLLLLPYLAWVSYAAALTVSLWRRNPGLL